MPFFDRAAKLISYSFGILSGLMGMMWLAIAIIRFTPLRLLASLIFFAGAAALFYVPRLQLKILSRAVRKEPEKSLRLRWLTFGAQLTGLLALGYTSQVWLVALLSAALLVFGHRYALYHIQHKPILTVRIAIFAAFHLAFLWMIGGLFTGQPYPQAQFAMLAMSIVSFEQFSRLNLYSGFGLALINLYVAATLTRDLAFALFLAAFIILFLAFFWQADSEDGVKDNPTILRSSLQTTNVKRQTRNLTFAWFSRAVPVVSRFTLPITLATTLVFIFTPHFAGRPIFMPLSLQVPIRQNPSSEIINPAVPLVQIQGMSTDSGEYYYGFAGDLDLSYRGGLSDKIMMYVRSPAASYWRSHGYDFYDGRTWSQSGGGEIQTYSRNSVTGRFLLRSPAPPGQQFVQTFFIAQPLPNLVFMGGAPVELYIASNEIAIDNSGGVRVGEALKPPMYYSVVSVSQDFPPDVLRAAGTNYQLPIINRYLQLPNTVTQRTRDLALELTRNALTPYDKVILLRDYLRDTYPYNYFPTPQQPNTDAVDQFLFVDKEGVCEQYVSALVVMLRTLGIPARLVAGYGAGDYNPVTNLYEVRADDAHAWAEVYFPNVEWVPFDPTPGWNGDPRTGPVKTWIFSGLGENLNLPRLPIGAIAETGAAIFTVAARPLIVVAGLAGLAAVAWGLWTLWSSRARRQPRSRPRGLHDHPARRRIFDAYRRAQRRLRSRRAPAQTAQEHATLRPELAGLADAVDIAAYRPEPPEEALTVRVAKARVKK